MNYEIKKQSTIENPLVSVIVPMYNVEAYIEETINSVLNQTLTNIEVILLDDGSTDNTVSIVEDLIKDYQNVTLVLKENTGPGLSRNLGIDMAKGEYISFVDSDDLIPADSLESMYNAAVENNVELVTGMSQSFNSKKKWFIASHLNMGAYDEGFKDIFNNPEMLYTLGPCNKMFKRDLISDIRYPADIKVTEDHPFIIRAYLKAKKIYTLDKIIYFYRQREDEDNISLSQIVNVNSANVISDIFKSLTVSDKLWDQYCDNKYISSAMKVNYYNRIIRADLWPAINKSIRGKNAEDQKKVFMIFKGWVEAMDPFLFNKLPLISHIITFQTLNRYLLLSKEAKRIHFSLLKICIKKLHPDLLEQLLAGSRGKEIAPLVSAVKRNSTYPIYAFLTKRNITKRRKKFVKNLNTKIAKRLVFNISKLLPVNDKKIIFATNKDTKFSGSFKVVFNELMKMDRERRYVPVGHFKKNRSFKELCKLYYDLATAKYVLLDDYYFQLYGVKTRKQTEVVQLWHAAGAFKKFGMSSIGSIDSNTLEFEKNAHQNYKQVIVSSQEVVKHYADAFGVPLQNVHPLGVPRTDLFFNTSYKEFVKKKYLNAYPQLKNKKVITYAPTFRGRPGERASFNLELDLESLYNEFGEEFILILKLHPSVTKGVHIPKEYKEFVLNLSKNDVNNVLIMTDILITDYSSIVFDYSLLNRPMIFFAYDLENYLEERGFYYRYEEFVPGPIAKTTDEIIKLIQNNNFRLDNVNSFANKFFDKLDGRAGERVTEHLFFKRNN